MSNDSGRRPYELKRRAEAMEETRQRIAQAAFELHGSVGPARTTITAIADRAGVERATVYRHFPDDLSLLRACVGHGLTAFPPPDPGSWAAVRDPEHRLRVALAELFAYYERTEGVWFNGVRDLPLLPALAQANQELGTFAHWEAMRSSLVAGWGARGNRRRLLEAALGHALDFRTWHSLVRTEGLTDQEAAEVIVAAVRQLAR
jgi:AcrR family transcriptional regulator